MVSRPTLCILLLGGLLAAAIWAVAISHIDAERADVLADEVVKNSNLAASHEERVSRSLQVFDLILLGMRDDYAMHGEVRDLECPAGRDACRPDLCGDRVAAGAAR